MPTISQSLIDEVVNRLNQEFQPEQIILFGSHAWGVPHEDSDLDLLVIVESSAEKPIQRSQRAHVYMRGIKIPMDILVKTRAEVDRFTRVPSSLEADILERGKVIYGRGEGVA